MSALKQVTGGPIRLIIDEVEYSLVPPSPIVLDELQDFVNLKPLRDLKKKLNELGDEISQEHRERLIDKALEACDVAVDILSEEGEKRAGSLEGIRFMIKLMIKEHHPESANDEAIGKIVRTDTLELWTDAINEAFSMMEDAMGPKAKQRLSRARTRTGRKKQSR